MRLNISFVSTNHRSLVFHHFPKAEVSKAKPAKAAEPKKAMPRDIRGASSELGIVMFFPTE